MRAIVLALALTGCHAIIDPASVSSGLALCRQEARDKMHETGSYGDALDAYEACKRREGIQ